MPEEPCPVAPVPRPRPQPIDPKKFLGGQNVEKLKGLIKDVETFVDTVKGKSKEAEDTFDDLKKFVGKFGETVDFMGVVVEANKQLMEKMVRNMENEFNRTLEGRHERTPR